MDIQLDVHCAVCGADLHAVPNISKYRCEVGVNPCGECLKEARQEGYRTGVACKDQKED